MASLDDTRAASVRRATLAAHGVAAPSPEALPDGLRSVPVAPPLQLSASFGFESLEATDVPLGGEQGYAYARYGHPNGRALERTIAALEGAEDAVATASGMAAITAVALALASAGDRILLQRDAYGGTVSMFRRDLSRLGIEVSLVDAYDPATVAAAVEGGARLLLVETLSNPLIRPVDVGALSAVCRAAATLLVVDGTFATPILSRPLEHGADLVLHSATKFIGGHHDLTAGVVCGAADLVRDVRRVCVRLGGRVAPFDAWLALRGSQTLALRMERAQANACTLADRLRAHVAVGVVHHPGWGAMLSFDCGSSAAADAVVRALRLCTLTPSLGGVTTTLSHPATSSHRDMSPAERAAIGVGDGLLRVSCGIEDVEDVWDDLSAALTASSSS